MVAVGSPSPVPSSPPKGSSSGSTTRSGTYKNGESSKSKSSGQQVGVSTGGGGGSSSGMGMSTPETPTKSALGLKPGESPYIDTGRTTVVRTGTVAPGTDMSTKIVTQAEPLREDSIKRIVERVEKPEPMKPKVTAGSIMKAGLTSMFDIRERPEQIKEFYEKPGMKEEAAKAALIAGGTIAAFAPVPGGRPAAIAAFTKAGVLGIGASTIATETLLTAGEKTASKEQRRFLESGQFYGARQAAAEAENLAIAEKGFTKSLMFELPGGQLYAGDPMAAKGAVREYYKNLGYSESDINTAVAAYERQRKFGAVGEFAGLLTISTASELAGRQFINTAFKAQTTAIAKKQATSKLFSIGFKQIGKAGIIEGIGSEVVQQKARGEKTDFGKIAFAGGVGGLTAGTIGGTISATRPFKTTISKGIEYATYIVDPLEKPGDIAADVLEKGAAKIRGTPVIVPTVVDVSAKSSPIILSTTTESPTKRPTQILSPSDFPAKVPTPIEPFQVKESPPDITKEIIIESPVPPTPTDSETFPTNVDVNVPIDIEGNVPNIFTPAPINVNVDLPTPVTTIVPTTTTIPTTSIYPYIPPPIPLLPGLNIPGLGGRGFVKGKKKKFISELQAGSLLAEELFSGASIFGTRQTSKKSKKAKPNKDFLNIQKQVRAILG